MEIDNRTGSDIDDGSNSSKANYVTSQGSTALGSATTDSCSSRRATAETPLETSVIPSPSRSEKTVENWIQTPVKRTLKRVETRKVPSYLQKFWRHKGHSFSSISVSNKAEKSLSLLCIKRANMKMEKSRKQLKLNAGEWNKNEKQGLEPVQENLTLTKNRLSGRRYKELFRSWARKTKVSDLMLGRTDAMSQMGGYITEADGSNKVDCSAFESSCSCYRQRADFNLKAQDCFCKTELSRGFYDVSLPEDGRELDAGLGLEPVDEHAHEMHCADSGLDIDIANQHKECVICMHGGKLLCCDGQGCRRSFHLSCVNPPLTCAPPGVWHCIWCIKKKIELGVHSVSEGIESILDAREVVSNDEVMLRQKQYLVKYKGLAHVHNCWIPERALLLEAPILFARYKRNAQTIKWKTEWSVPHRMLQKRMLLFPEHRDNNFHRHDGNETDCHYEWLVKWTGLNYDHATWELENTSFLRTPEATKLITDFGNRHQKSKSVSHFSKEDEGRKIAFPELSEHLFGGSPGLRNCHLSYVNQLREYWHRGQNAVVFDGQERVVKVVLFILSLQGDRRLPFLIITASTALSLWEAEFSRWASSANIVVYKGDREVRAIIRTLEFYNEVGCIMFQVLLSPPDVVVEDLKELERIKWEAIVIDECQRPQISVHLKQIKMLPADMRLLLFSCQIKDRRFNYHDVLSLLDSEFVERDKEDLQIEPNVAKLKERLAQFVAFECKSGISKFAEYWVPVWLSNVQIEQYCASLLSNSTLLCSCLKDSAGALCDILMLTRKCCDHPCIVDQSLQSSVTRGLPLVDHLDVGINVSGKLQLLDKILLEIKKRGLRVLILFQSLGGSELISIGDILDDFIHQRFGKDCYARIDGEIVRSKKQVALNMFNDKENGKFVCLLESRACLSSIKLSSVDIVILFDSDWNPLNDLRALQKITIDSQFEQLKVFRLYSSCTVEEKVLILAKQGATLDRDVRKIKHSTCHMLLTWGASYLFNKLDDFQGCEAPVLHSKISSEQSLLDDVFCELSALLPYNGENGMSTKCSIILYVQHSEGAYPRNISLLGEVEAQSMDNFFVTNQLMDSEPSHVVWTNLLKGRHPMWKYLSMPTKRIRGKGQLVDDLLEGSEFEGDAVKSKRRKVVNNTVNLVYPRPRLRNKRKAQAGVKESKLAGASGRSNHVSDSLSMPHVAQDVSMECDGRDTVTLEHVMEVKQHSEAATPTSVVTSTKASSPTVQLHICPARGDSSLPSHKLPISTNPPYAERGQADVPGSWGTQNLQCNRENASGRQAQVARQPTVEGSTWLSNSSVVQIITHLPLQPSTCTPVGGSESADINIRSTNIVSESGNNHPPVKSEVLQSACSDPLQIEMERIQKDENQTIKIHEDTKLRLITERDKEIDEICKKYDALLQEADMNLAQQRKDLETYKNKVHVNRLLAEALTQKHNTIKAPVSQAKQQETISSFVNKIFQLYFQEITATTSLGLEQSSASLPMSGPPLSSRGQVVNHPLDVQLTAPRTTSRIEQSSASLPMAGLPPKNTPVQLMTHSSAIQQTAASTSPRVQKSSAIMPMTAPPPSELVIHSSAVQQTAAEDTQRHQQSSSRLHHTGQPGTLPVQLMSHSSVLSTNSCRPHAFPTIHCTGNLLAVNELRAPAPHLRYARPSPSVSAPDYPTFLNLVPFLQSPINPPVSSSMLNLAIPRLPTCQSGLISEVYQAEIAGGLLATRSLSAPDLPMGINTHPVADLNQIIDLQALGSNYRAV